MQSRTPVEFIDSPYICSTPCRIITHIIIVLIIADEFEIATHFIQFLYFFQTVLFLYYPYVLLRSKIRYYGNFTSLLIFRFLSDFQFLTIIEKILLCVAAVLTEQALCKPSYLLFVRLMPYIEFLHNALYPYINRESVSF